MEPPSVLPRGGRAPWQDLLLAVSLLTLWNPPTTAHVTVESVPPSATEGKDVLLQVHNLPRDTGRFSWFKGATTEENRRIVSYIVDVRVIIPGPAHSGRETVYPKGSLLFRNITLNDTGYYTLQIVDRNYEVAQVTGRLRIFQPLAQPTLHASNTTVTEDKDSVVLTCSTSNPEVSIGWLFNGQSLKLMERMTLSQDNSTLTIRPVRKEDAGNYQCEVSNPGDSRKSDPVMLAVSYEGSTTGFPVGSIVGITVGVLVGLALVATLGCLLLRTRTGRASGWRDLRELCCPAPKPRHGPTSSSKSQDSLPGPTTAIPIYQFPQVLGAAETQVGSGATACAREPALGPEDIQEHGPRVRFITFLLYQPMGAAWTWSFERGVTSCSDVHSTLTALSDGDRGQCTLPAALSTPSFFFFFLRFYLFIF
ncbi:carcinoembryonic antigen-related cell adhesion molecule 21 isoform X5 [Mustela putorius furo]|uniref:Carcinoembryonic antigen-related cell adhesion molecule 21 isoform X5 n=1 Tax=Mustela putorius furo TaxID=9669 RepID=A0A8U0RYH4_MUSPF|nr:carcinoembryonic antigen-related cell adhesion molecule 21 isoform X5 [Mustela putorius furo]